MIVYLFDNSLEGLLTAIYDGFYNKPAPDKILSYDHYQAQLMDQTLWIETCDQKASRVHEGILDRLGEEFYMNFLQAFLSEDHDVGTCLFLVLKAAFKGGRDIIFDLRQPLMRQFKKMRTGVVREQHLLLGLVRFVRLKGDIYYCEIEPKYHQLPLIADHFAQRLADQLWVIRDMKRGLALFFDKKTWEIRPIETPLSLELEEEEAIYQTLWKTFHKHIAIEERRNPKLQGAYIPKRYWKYLIEDKT